MRVLLYDQNAIHKLGIGGKAQNLMKLDALEIKVPRWSVLPQEAILSQLPKNIQTNKIDTLLHEAKVPSELNNQLAKRFGDDYDTITYAVRSSAIDEDGCQHSFAGLYESYLHVPFSDIEDKIKAVWRSVNSKRVRKYREENSLPVNLGIGVIIQEMISPQVAGVGFGINPVTGDTNSKAISAVYGLGEGLVSGELDADSYIVDSENIESNIVKKTHAFLRNKKGNGIQKSKVRLEKQTLPALSKDQLREISTLLDKLQNAFGQPQDIEFAYASGQLILLQTRPITATGTHIQGEYILWDNSNIIESYPGVTTPLTFSFIIKMYEFVYRQLAGLMGVREKDLDRNTEVFANTLGLVRGRVYYNLLNWYKMLALLPGYSINANYLEKMLGIEETFELDEKYQMSKGVARIRLFIMFLKLGYLHIRLSDNIKKFHTHLNTVINQYKAIDFSALDPQEIISKYNVYEKTLLLEWKAPQVNDFFAMIWFGILEKLTKKHASDDINLQNDLLCGSQDIISVEPIHRTNDIAVLVLSRPDATKLFKDEHPAKIWERLTNGDFPQIKLAIDEYLDKFGERCVGELKLESISYTQDPIQYVKIIKSYVQQEIKFDNSFSHREDDVRASAEKRVFESLKRNPIKKWMFKYVLNKTRNIVSNRENLRFERTRGFGMVRTMFTALGKRWHRLNKLDDPMDIFYLELSEIKSMENQEFDKTLRAKIEVRKRKFANYKLQDPPQNRFFTYGNNFSDKYIYSTEKLESKKDYLSGIGCCPGRVQGKVQVINSPDQIESLNGDILITSSTDPGWITLFPTASAIIVERGSLLSHSAIVSREMGIPCIVSVKGLINSLETGNEILMDGSTGEINIIK